MPSTVRPRAAVAVVALLIAASIVPAAGAPASGTVQSATCAVPAVAGSAPVPASPTTDVASEETADTTVARGDVAAVPLVAPDGDVTITIEGHAYHARLNVTDADAETTLYVNTYLAGNGSAVDPDAFRVDGEATVRPAGGNATAVFAPGSYAVTVRDDGAVLAERWLNVTEPRIGDLTARRGLPRAFSLDSADAARNGSFRSLLPAGGEGALVEGETLLLRIDAPSLLGVLAAQPGETTTERFLALRSRTPVGFDISGPCGGMFLGEALEAGSARAVADYRTGTVSVLVDTGSVPGVTAGSQTAFLDVRPVGPFAPLGDAGRRRASLRILDREQSLARAEDGVLSLEPTANATISGETNVSAGTELSVRVSSWTDPTADWSTTTVVGEDGSFEATLNLSGAADPGVFEVRVGPFTYPATSGDAPVVHWEASPFVEDEGRRSAQVFETTLPADGYVIAYRYDATTDRFRVADDVETGDDTAGRRDDQFWLGTGPHPDHLLLVAHREGNGDDDFDGPSVDPPVRVGGRAVQQWKPVQSDVGDHPSVAFDADRVVSPDTGTPTPSPGTETPSPDTGTPSLSPTVSPASTTPPANSDTDDPLEPATTTGDGPGFGLIASAVALLSAAALLVRRRD